MSLNNKGSLRFSKKIKTSLNTERAKPSLKYDIKKYKILNNFLNKHVKLKNIRENKNHRTIDNAPHKIKNKIFSKNDISYAPRKDNQEGEKNFIHLIKALINSNENNKKLESNISVNNQLYNEDPYKPKGYNYYKYSLEHPNLISDDKRYSKIIQELNSKNENINYDRCLSYENYNKNNNINELFINKSNKLDNNNNQNNIESTIMPISKSCAKYISTSNKDNFSPKRNKSDLVKINYNIKNDILKNSDNDTIDIHNIKSITENNKNNLNTLPLTNSVDSKNFVNYNKFNYLKKKDNNINDIFNLKDDNFTKQKTSEQYLFKNNYKPMKTNIDKETNINNIGWSPKELKSRSKINMSSVAFNILCPNFKDISPSKRELDLLNHNNSYKPNLISEYVEKCKPGDTELRKEYIDKLNDNKTIFHRKNYCASYNDLHHEYKDLIYDLF